MKNLFIINGYDSFDRAKGGLNRSIADEWARLGKYHFQVEQTTVVEGYDIEVEIAAFKRADFIIIQTPIYWFSLPGVLKKYIDDVFVPGVFFEKTNQFGRGGLLKEKCYMLSVTWGAKQTVFNAEPNQFLQGLSEDQLLLPVHMTFDYCGMQKQSTFSIYSAMKGKMNETNWISIQDHFNSYVRY